MTVGDGLVRLRAVQIGKQTTFATAVAATRRVPWKGQIDYDPARTDPDIDAGSIDPYFKPVSGAPVIGAPLTGPVTYNDLPYRLSAALKGGITPTGATAKAWSYQVASLTADPFDYFSIETGDDQAATDGIQGYGGVIDTFSEDQGADLGTMNFSDAWIFAAANLATNRTAALTLDPSPVYVQGDETDITIDSNAAAIGNTLAPDALHSWTLNINNNLDKKRFANGSNQRKKYAGWARGGRVIELVLTFAKTTATMAEFNTINADPVPNRYIMLRTVSPTVITGSTFYTYHRRGAFRLFNTSYGEIGGNATIILTYHAYYDATLGYAFKADVVNTLAAL